MLSLPVFNIIKTSLTMPHSSYSALARPRLFSSTSKLDLYLKYRSHCHHYGLVKNNAAAAEMATQAIKPGKRVHMMERACFETCHNEQDMPNLKL